MAKIIPFPKNTTWNDFIKLQTELQKLKEDLKDKIEELEYYKRKYEELLYEKENNNREKAGN